MNTLDRAATVTLIAAGVIAVVVGLVVIVLAHTMTRSRVAASNELLNANLETARKAVRVLRKHDDELTNITRLPAHAADTARRLPPALAATADTLQTTRHVLRHTVATLRTLQSGVGFFTPGSPLDKNADALAELADDIARMREVVAASREPVSALVDQTVAAAGAQRALGQALADAGIGPKLIAKRLERTLQLQKRADLPAAAAWQQTAIGGFYLLAGLMLAGLGGLWRRLLDGDSDHSLPPSEP